MLPASPDGPPVRDGLPYSQEYCASGQKIVVPFDRDGRAGSRRPLRGCAAPENSVEEYTGFMLVEI